MAYCSVFTCKNSTEKCSFSKHGVTFHKFPKTPDIKNKWIMATGRPDWEPAPNSKICSSHFKEDDYYGNTLKRRSLVPCCVPTINVWKICSEVSCPTEYPIIARVYLYLKKEYEYLKQLYEERCDLSPLSDILRRTVDATGLSVEELISVMETHGLEQHLPHNVTWKRSKCDHSRKLSDTVSVKIETEETQIKIEPEVQLETSQAIQIEELNNYQEETEQSQINTQPRPYLNAERQRRFREKRKAILNSCIKLYDSIQKPGNVEISQPYEERQNKYKKLLFEQNMKELNIVQKVKPYHHLDNMDHAERKRYLNKIRQSRFRAKQILESTSTSSQQEHTERALSDKVSVETQIKIETVDPVYQIDVEPETPLDTSQTSNTVSVKRETQETRVKIENQDPTSSTSYSKWRNKPSTQRPTSARTESRAEAS